MSWKRREGVRQYLNRKLEEKRKAEEEWGRIWDGMEIRIGGEKVENAEGKGGWHLTAPEGE